MPLDQPVQGREYYHIVCWAPSGR